MILDSGELAGRLFSRLRPLLEQYGLGRIENNLRVTGLRGRGKVYELTRLNERLRFLKYVGGEYFRPHWDGMYTDPGSGECSLYTIQLYLNGDGEQDLGELQREMGREKEKAGENEKEKWTNADVNAKLLGGATSFIPRFEEAETQVRVFPKTGSVLVFQQSDLLHGGDPVVRGSKFTVRTDVMYRVVEC